MRRQYIRGPLADRFWPQIICDIATGCWLWTGYRDPNGYGEVWDPERHQNIRTHRASWELQIGPIPLGLFVCHNCPSGDNPGCVRPSHLFLGSNQANLADMRAKGRNKIPHWAGERNHQSKLTENAVRDIRTRYREGLISKSALAREYGVTHTLIRYVIALRTWKHVV